MYPSQPPVPEIGGQDLLQGLELLHDACAMDLDCALADLQFRGNDLVGLSPDDPIEHLGLPFRESGKPLVAFMSNSSP